MAVGLVIALFFLLVLRAAPLRGVASSLQYDTLDYWFALRDTHPMSNVGVVAIDESTVRRWQGRTFDATDVAALLRALKRAEAAGLPAAGPARITVLFRLHHSFTDGLGVISLTRGLFDEGAAHRQPLDGAADAPTAGSSDDAAGAPRDRVAPRLAAVRRGGRSLTSTVRGVLGLAARGSAPVVPWQGRVSSERSLHVVELPLKVAQAKAKATATDFEAMFLNSMFSQMTSGIKGEGPFGDTPGTGVWRSMLTEQYSKSFAKAGGVGISKDVYHTLIMQQAGRTS